jgi:hypothetical protein
MALHHPIPTGDAAVVFMADALSRVRELSEIESRVLQRAITRNTGAFRRWTPAEDRKLMKMHKAKLRAAQMALSLNRSENAIYVRIRDLKKLARAGR